MASVKLECGLETPFGCPVKIFEKLHPYLRKNYFPSSGLRNILNNRVSVWARGARARDPEILTAPNSNRLHYLLNIIILHFFLNDFNIYILNERILKLALYQNYTI